MPNGVASEICTMLSQVACRDTSDEQTVPRSKQGHQSRSAVADHVFRSYEEICRGTRVLSLCRLQSRHSLVPCRQPVQQTGKIEWVFPNEVSAFGLACEVVLDESDLLHRRRAQSLQ